MNIQDLKKVELHLHLDGSVKPEDAEEILCKANLDDDMKVSPNNKDLTEYLTKFDIPISVMQTKRDLNLVAKGMIEQLISDNVIYAEIRFAPIFHTKNGLSINEVVDAVLDGLKSKKVKTNLILCMMRGMKNEDNFKIIDLAKSYLGKGVCAVDLAGDEINYPISIYKKLFDYAKLKGVPFTIHAGEAGNSNDVLRAVMYGAKRIGHGIKAIEDEAVMEILRKKNIVLEICPTSNVQTNNAGSIKTHPFDKLYKEGVLVTVNTDNRTVSNITLDEEYIKLQRAFNYSEKDFKQFNINAINSAFISEEEKKELLKKLN